MRRAVSGRKCRSGYERVTVMTIKEMIRRKQELGYSNERIAELSGVPLGTVQKIFAGITKSPRYDTISALENVLKDRTSVYQYGSDAAQYGTALLKEPGVFYGSSNTAKKEPEHGYYSIEDYYSLPDERRAELIDGHIYDMVAPEPVHQIIVLQLFRQLDLCAEQHRECEVFAAPCDVRLDRDDWTMVQPDIFVVCDHDQVTKKRIEGAPDFVIEVISPSSRAHDMFRKLSKYRFSGVREYWIVDPDRQKVYVYDLEHDEGAVTYTFSDTIPVLISGGDCEIDFQKILDRAGRYL